MTIKISDRAQAIKPSPTLGVSALAKQMKQQGIDVINFGVGEPDFPTPDYIKQAGIQAIRDNFSHYTDSNGMPELRNAIVRKLEQDNGLSYQPDEILVSPGAKASIITVLMAVCDPRDEVLIPTPYWVSYPSQVEMAGAVPVLLETDESTEFKISPEMLEEQVRSLSNPKALILNTPNNPTGTVYTKSELEQIAEICLKYGIMILSDEIYEKLIYDGESHFSIAAVSEAVKEITVVINGVSKAYAMTGWRLGYAAGPREIIRYAGRIQGHTTSCVNAMTQKAVITALDKDDGSVEKMRLEFEKRRNYLIEQLNAIAKVSCALPRGAFYAMPNISYYLRNNAKKITNSVQLCEYLIQNYHMAVVPGAAFGADDYVRFSYATSMENIKKGLQRFADGLLSLTSK